MLYRRFFAQGRNGYMGVDEYHYDSLEAYRQGEDYAHPGRCMHNVGCYKPLKIGREVADLMNRAYWNGRHDAGEETPADSDMIDALVLAANNDQRAYNQIVSAVRTLRRVINGVAEQTAKANAEWHDDPEADDHAAFHAPAKDQFPFSVRDAAIKELVRYYLDELNLN